MEERSELKALTRAATKTTGKRFLYARALLLCDRGPEGPGWTVRRWASRPAIELKRRFVEQGLEFALERKRRVRPPRKVIFDGDRGSLGRLGLFAGPAGAEALDRKWWNRPWVERVSDDGAAAKKNQLSLIGRSIGGPRAPQWRTFWRSMPVPTTPVVYG